MMFCKIIGAVAAAFSPVYVELVALANAVADPIEAHINRLGSFCLTVSFAMRVAVLLSVAMGVAGYG
jgi:hypothetical protein